MEEFHPHSDRETLEPIRLWLAHCISNQAMTIHNGGGGGKTVKMTKMGGLEEVVSCGFGKLKKKKILKRWRSRKGSARYIPIKEKKKIQIWL